MSEIVCTGCHLHHNNAYNLDQNVQTYIILYVTCHTIHHIVNHLLNSMYYQFVVGSHTTNVSLIPYKITSSIIMIMKT